MNTRKHHLRLLLFTLFTLLFVAPGNAALTPADIKTAVRNKKPFDCTANALAILNSGGFSGFKPAPGCTLESSDDLHDFLVQNIAVDENGNPTNENPMTAKLSRDFRAGDKLPYVMTNYPRSTEGDSPANRHHRYAIPFATGGDGTGQKFPVIAGIRDLAPTAKSTEFGTLGMRDIVSMIGIFPSGANYMGAYIPKKEGYAVSVGQGYTDGKTAGMSRFFHPLFPNPVPAHGNRWHATILQKTISVGRDADLPKFPAHQKNSLVPQLTIGKRAMFVYGTRDKPTKPLDTLAVILAFNNPNDLGTAPAVNNRATQCERIYCTREFGYATRWDSWNCKETPENIQRAQRAYQYNNCGMPFDFSGKYSEHLEIGPVVEDKELGVYKHTQTTTDPKTGKKETLTWYMIGCHDYTNIEPKTPFDPMRFCPPEKLNPLFIKLYGIE